MGVCRPNGHAPPHEWWAEPAGAEQNRTSENEHLTVYGGANARGNAHDVALGAADWQRLGYQLLQKGLNRQREERANHGRAVPRGEMGVGETTLESVGLQVLL